MSSTLALLARQKTSHHYILKYKQFGDMFIAPLYELSIPKSRNDTQKRHYKNFFITKRVVLCLDASAHIIVIRNSTKASKEATYL